MSWMFVVERNESGEVIQTRAIKGERIPEGMMEDENVIEGEYGLPTWIENLPPAQREAYYHELAVAAAASAGEQ